jgi:glycosyltransferase involved in cell wall biosynthesis
MANTMKISVVICTYNRDQFIGDALKSLSEQLLPPTDFEIVIVNNNSSDHTEKISLNFIKNNPQLDCKYVVETNQGLSFARNRGIKEAKYEIITYIDDDAFTKPDFLEKIYTYFNAHPTIAGIGGKVIPRYENEEPKWMNKFLYGFVTKVDHGEVIHKFSGNKYPAGCNMSYRKNLLIQCGGFNNNLKWRADDKYIYFEIIKLNNQVIYLPQAAVEHQIDASRTEDTNFFTLSIKFGSEESIRVKNLGNWAFLKKLLEFIFKLGGSLVIGLVFILKGHYTKAKYTIIYRYLALKGLIAGN